MKQIQQQEKVRSFIYIPLGIFFILLHTFHTFEALILLTLLDLYTSSWIQVAKYFKGKKKF